MNTLLSVSYTHLNVYKRLGNDNLGSSLYGTFSLAAQYIKFSNNSVTDVYKRQPLRIGVGISNDELSALLEIEQCITDFL